MSVKDFLAKYQIGLGLVGGSIILSTTWGTCSFLPTGDEAEEPAKEEATEEAAAPAEGEAAAPEGDGEAVPPAEPSE